MNSSEAVDNMERKIANVFNSMYSQLPVKFFHKERRQTTFATFSKYYTDSTERRDKTMQ